MSLVDAFVMLSIYHHATDINHIYVFNMPSLCHQRVIIMLPPCHHLAYQHPIAMLPTSYQHSYLTYHHANNTSNSAPLLKITNKIDLWKKKDCISAFGKNGLISKGRRCLNVTQKK